MDTIRSQLPYDAVRESALSWSHVQRVGCFAPVRYDAESAGHVRGCTRTSLLDSRPINTPAASVLCSRP